MLPNILRVKADVEFIMQTFFIKEGRKKRKFYNKVY